MTKQKRRWQLIANASFYVLMISHKDTISGTTRSSHTPCPGHPAIRRVNVPHSKNQNPLARNNQLWVGCLTSRLIAVSKLTRSRLKSNYLLLLVRLVRLADVFLVVFLVVFFAVVFLVDFFLAFSAAAWWFSLMAASLSVIHC